MNCAALILAVLLSLSACPCVSFAAETVQYVHTDALGSIVAVTDQAGQVIERRNYEPFGAQSQPSLQNGPGYAGHVSDDATGLSYMQQRYYDPNIGRFLSSDPVHLGKDGSNFNRYSYVANNPYSGIDPDGRYVCKASAEVCSGLKSALRNIRSSAKAQTGTRIANSRSAEVSRFYGKEGVENGVVVQDTSINAYGKAETSGSVTTISFNVAAMEQMSTPETSAQRIFTSTALHEGSHGLDQRSRLQAGLAPMTRSRTTLLQGEKRAYRAEAAYHESLGTRSPWGLWEVESGRNDGLINEESRKSVETTCEIGRCTP